ncbi:hypothetical protein P7C70_g4248, partial [Phenoliferia sp. Uapishka_3]
MTGLRDGDEETIAIPLTPRPDSPELLEDLAARQTLSIRHLVRQLRGQRGRPLLAAALLTTILLVYSSIQFTTSYLPTAYTPQDSKSLSFGHALSPKDAALPELALPGGTRYPRAVPPSWPDPWESDPRIANQWLSDFRFPPLEDAVGVEADSELNEGRRAKVGLGTEPPLEFDVPNELVVAAQRYFRSEAKGWQEMGLNEGEGFDKDGRPLMIPRESIYMGKDDGWKAPKLGAPRQLPKIQAHLGDPRSQGEKEQDGQRREWVRRAFLHVWEGYKMNSWGHDEMRPLSRGSTDKFNGWGATIVDALDTLLIMGLEDEYLLARSHVAQIDFSYFAPKDPTSFPPPAPSTLPPLTVLQPPFHPSEAYAIPPNLESPQSLPTFETVIRYLGSLISAYDLAGDPLMLGRAKELGDWLLPSLGTRSGLALRSYRMGMNPNGGPTGISVLAEVGSMSLEFTRLSQITEDPIYFEAISRATDCLDKWKAKDRVLGLFPTHLNSEEPDYLTGLYSFGGQADSFYEYLIKEHQLLQGALTQYPRMYAAAINSATQHLIRPIRVVTGITDMVTIGDMHYNTLEGRDVVSYWSPRLDHLTCFAGGMLALGSKLLARPKDLKTATQFTKACVWAYEATRSGLAPEIMQLWGEKDPRRLELVTLPGMYFAPRVAFKPLTAVADGTTVKSVKGDPMGLHSGSMYHIQRPETIESVLYMYRVTGDRAYQDKGWKMFTAWVQATIVPRGFAHVKDVNSPAPEHDDSGIESFVYSETLKYYYLLFSPPDMLSLEDWVFTTEAHPFRIPKGGERPLSEDTPFWKGEKLKVPSEKMGQGYPTGPPTPSATSPSYSLPSFLSEDPLSDDPNSSSDEDSDGNAKPPRAARFDSKGLRRPTPSYYYDAEYDPAKVGSKKRRRRGGMKGIPVFEPTMEEFEGQGGFYGYVKRIEKYGLRSGVVKVVPPKEWSDALPTTAGPLHSVRMREPIEQHMTGSQGLYRVTNVAKSRIWNPAQWKELSELPKHAPPDFLEQKPDRTDRSTKGTTTRKAPVEGAVPRVRKPAGEATGERKRKGRKGKRKAPIRGKGKGKAAEEEEEGDKADEGDAEDDIEGDHEDHDEKIHDPDDESLDNLLDSTMDSMLPSPAATSHAPSPPPHPASPSIPSLSATDTPISDSTLPVPAPTPTSTRKKRPTNMQRAEPTEEEWQTFIGTFEELPNGMRKEDYTVEMLREVERAYWRTLTFGEPPVYGADMKGSLFDDSTKAWNVAHLGDLLPKLAPSSCKIPGVVSPYLYFGMWRATFAWHVEDADLYSINYIHFGAPKFWYSVPQEQSDRFERIMEGFFPTDRTKCSQFLRHKSFLASPRVLANMGITLNRVVQLPGEFILTYPKGYHSGFNLGFNAAESINFATERWLPLGKVAKACYCIGDSVNIDVDVWIREAALAESVIKNEAFSILSAPTSLSFSGRKRNPPTYRRDQEEGSPAPNKRVKLEHVALPPPPPPKPREMTKKAKIEAEKIAKEESWLCALCPCMSTDGLVRVGEPGVRPRKVLNAHRECVMFTPATWIELDALTNEEIVRGYAGIEKARWKLEDSGVFLDASDAPTPPVEQLPTPVESSSVATSTSVIDPPTADTPPKEDDGAMKLTVLCRLHNPAYQKVESERKAAELKKRVDQLVVQSRIKVRTSGGVFEVTYTSSLDFKEAVSVTFDDGKRSDVKWKNVIWPDSEEVTRQKEAAAVRGRADGAYVWEHRPIAPTKRNSYQSAPSSKISTPRPVPNPTVSHYVSQVSTPLHPLAPRPPQYPQQPNHQARSAYSHPYHYSYPSPSQASTAPYAHHYNPYPPPPQSQAPANSSYSHSYPSYPPTPHNYGYPMQGYVHPGHHQQQHPPAGYWQPQYGAQPLPRAHPYPQAGPTPIATARNPSN